MARSTRTTPSIRGQYRVKTAAVAMLALVLTASCGGGNDGADSAAPTTTPTSGTDALSSETTTTVATDGSTTAPSQGGTRATNTPTTARRATNTTRTTTRGIVTKPAPAVQGLVQATTTAPSAPSEPVQPGGTLTVLFQSESNGFDPTKGVGSASGNDMQRMHALYDMLVYQDPKSGSVVPSLAQSMTSTDAKTWTLKVRPNLKFTDGSVYDANAVKFNWERHSDPANGSPWAASFRALTFRVVDNLTIEITLNTPNGQFPRVVSRQLSFIASPAAIQAAGPGAAYNSAKPVGAGPFMLQSWIRDSQMVLVRNPNYWNAPRPYVDQLVFRVITDPNQRNATFRSGTGDLSAADVNTVNDMKKSFPVYASPAINTIGLGMQQGHAPFNDKNVRRAMMLAFDVEEYNKIVNQNVFETADTAFPSNYPYTDPAIAWPKPDLAAAQRLVDDYVATKNGGKDITFAYTYVTPAGDTAAQLLQAQLQRLNKVKVNLKAVSVNQLVADLIAKNFDMMTLSYFGVDPDPEFIEAALCKGTRNFYDYCNTELDKQLNDTRTSLDAAARNQALKNAQKIMLEDVLYVPHTHTGYMVLYRNNVRDLDTFDDGGLLWDRIWLKR